MRNQAFSTTHANARALRTAMTDSERKLWRRLRGEQLGVKFRRQHPLGSYIADFACLEPKLIVELDGSQHAEQAEYDARREAFFREHGFIVLRFATDAPFRNMDGVLTVIVEHLGLQAARPVRSVRPVRPLRPHPNPPPEGEGERNNRSNSE